MITRLPKIVDLRKQVKKSVFQGDLIAVDPGETTGITLLQVYQDEIKLIEQEQLDSWPLDNFVNGITPYILEEPAFVVYEAYHVYAWRLNEHTFAEIPTIQIIGSLKTLCIQNIVPYGKQTAQVGKGFFTDERLKTFGAFIEGQPHARDSLRHALQFIVFGLKGS